MHIDDGETAVLLLNYAPSLQDVCGVEAHIITCFLSYLLSPRSRVLLEKLTGFQLVKKFPAIHGTRRFITAFTIARHLSLCWASSIQSIRYTYHFLKIQLRIILPSTPVSPKWSISLRFPHQIPVNASPLPHKSYMPHSSYSSRYDHPHVIGCGVQIIKLLIM
jgi:hypothetical protein